MPSLQIKRGTRAQLDAAAAASGLRVGEPYLVTDEHKLAVGLSQSLYAGVMREDAVVVSATAPASPYLNQIWIEI
jgi:hypothetical protein